MACRQGHAPKPLKPWRTRSLVLKRGSPGVFGVRGARAPEEDEVALVVECGDLATAEGRVLVEQARQLAAQAVPQPRGKAVQDQLRLCPRSPPMALVQNNNPNPISTSCGFARAARPWRCEIIIKTRSAPAPASPVPPARGPAI